MSICPQLRARDSTLPLFARVLLLRGPYRLRLTSRRYNLCQSYKRYKPPTCLNGPSPCLRELHGYVRCRLTAAYHFRSPKYFHEGFHLELQVYSYLSFRIIGTPRKRIELFILMMCRHISHDPKVKVMTCNLLIVRMITFLFIQGQSSDPCRIALANT